MNSLTDEFVLLRTNAIQRKRFQTDQVFFFVKYSSNIKIFFTAFSFLLIVTQFSGNDGQDDESYAQLLRDEENGSNFSNPPRYVIC